VSPEVARRDRRGRPYTAMMDPELRRGRRPPNYGRRFPPEILTSDEVNRLLAGCGRGVAGLRNRAMIVVLWRCGLRIHELVALHPRDVDLDLGTVTVREGKGRKRRVVGIDAGGAAILERWMRTRSKLEVARGAPLFCTISVGNVGGPVGMPYFRTALARAGARAGIDKRVHPHGLRHTFAVELLREGVSLVHIQKLLGHSDLATTARYVDHLMPLEAVEAARARAWPVDVAA
jgi:site-specific recombinase XerD